MKPVLVVLRYAGASAKRSIYKSELIDSIAKEFRLTEPEFREMLPSGQAQPWVIGLAGLTPT